MGEAVSIDWDAQPLGVESDRAIAKRLRVSSSTVTRERNRRGIPALVRVSGPGLVRGIDWDAQPLATTPASVLAKRLGVRRASVDEAAKTRGIKCPPLRPATTPPPVFPTPTDYDYRRLLSRLPRVVLPMLERRRLEHWSDDVVAHAALKVYELHRKGRRCSHRATRLCVLSAIHDLIGTKARSMLFAPMESAFTVPVATEDPYSRSIALWRLQEAWDLFAPSERAAVLNVLVGDTADQGAMSRVRAKMTLARA
jgi:hypothetical protein